MGHSDREFDVFSQWLRNAVIANDQEGVFITSNSRSEVRGISALLEREGITHVLEPVTASQHGEYNPGLLAIPMDVMAISIPNKEDIAKFVEAGLDKLPRNQVASREEALDIVFSKQR